MSGSLTYRIDWRGIALSVTHTPKKWGVIEHIQIESDRREPFPGAKSGYHTCYLCPEDLAEYEDAGDFALQLLDFLAGESGWTGQLSLF